MAVAMAATDDVQPQLIELAQHDNVSVRKEAVVALGHCTPRRGHKSSRSGNVTTPIGSVAEAARQSLARLLPRRHNNIDRASRKRGAADMIDGITNWLCLLAARPDSARVWGRFDHQRPTFGSTGWMIVAGLVALLAAAALLSHWLSKRRQRDFWYDSSSRLFRELCRAHRLDLANRRLMQKLAAARGVENRGRPVCRARLFRHRRVFPQRSSRRPASCASFVTSYSNRRIVSVARSRRRPSLAARELLRRRRLPAGSPDATGTETLYRASRPNVRPGPENRAPSRPAPIEPCGPAACSPFGRETR